METDLVGSTRSDDLDVGHTMGSLSERSHAALGDMDRGSRLTTENRTRYTGRAEVTPELFHDKRDTSRADPGRYDPSPPGGSGVGSHRSPIPS